jgi:D-glycero-D-manno-heptose 1,7-bisphosphate phosphatase
MGTNKALFLDRDGIINVERGDYTWRVEDFQIMDGIINLINRAKSHGFLVIIITNQAGIAKGLYDHSDVLACHEYFLQHCERKVDALYYAPGHPSVSESLSRKPGSLLFEKAMAKYQIDPGQSWMIGDKERDLIPARSLGISTILLGSEKSAYADHHIESLQYATHIIT